MFTLRNKSVVSEVRNPVAEKKPQEIKIRTLWAIHVFLSFLSVDCFTYSVEKVLHTEERPLQRKYQ